MASSKSRQEITQSCAVIGYPSEQERFDCGQCLFSDAGFGWNRDYFFNRFQGKWHAIKRKTKNDKGSVVLPLKLA